MFEELNAIDGFLVTINVKAVDLIKQCPYGTLIQINGYDVMVLESYTEVVDRLVLNYIDVDLGEDAN